VRELAERERPPIATIPAYRRGRIPSGTGASAAGKETPSRGR